MTETNVNTTLNDTEELQRLLKLFVIAPGFHSTNKPATKKIFRKKSVKIESQGRPYKAVVVVMLDGGADSFNMVVPHVPSQRSLH